MSARPAGHASEQPGFYTPGSAQSESLSSPRPLTEAELAALTRLLDFMRNNGTEDAPPAAVNPTLLDRRSAQDDTDYQDFSVDEFLANLEYPVPSTNIFNTDNAPTLPTPYEVTHASAIVTPPFAPRLFSEAPAIDNNAYFPHPPEAVFAFDTFNAQVLDVAAPPVVDASFALYSRADASPQQAPLPQIPPPVLLPAHATQYEGPPAASVDQRPQETEVWPVLPVVRRIHPATQVFMDEHRSNPPSREASLTEILPAKSSLVSAVHHEGPPAVPVDPYPEMSGGWPTPAQDYEMSEGWPALTQDYEMSWSGTQEAAMAPYNVLPQIPVPDVPSLPPYTSHQYAGANEFVDNATPFQAAEWQAGSGALSSARTSNDDLPPPFPPFAPFASTYPAGYMPGVERAPQAFQDAAPYASHASEGQPWSAPHASVGQPWSSEYSAMHGTAGNIAAILPPAQPSRVLVMSTVDEHNAVPAPVATPPFPPSHGVAYDSNAAVATPPMSAKRLGKMKEEPLTPVVTTPAATSAGPGPARTKKERASYSPYRRKEAKPSPSGSSAPAFRFPIYKQSESPSPFTHTHTHTGTLDFRAPDTLKISVMTPSDFDPVKGRMQSTPMREFGGEGASVLLPPYDYAGAPGSWAPGAMKPDPDARDPPLALFADESDRSSGTARQETRKGGCLVKGCPCPALLERPDALQRHLNSKHKGVVVKLLKYAETIPAYKKQLKGNWKPLGIVVKFIKEEMAAEGREGHGPPTRLLDWFDSL